MSFLIGIMKSQLKAHNLAVAWLIVTIKIRTNLNSITEFVGKIFVFGLLIDSECFLNKA